MSDFLSTYHCKLINENSALGAKRLVKRLSPRHNYYTTDRRLTVGAQLLSAQRSTSAQCSTVLRPPCPSLRYSALMIAPPQQMIVALTDSSPLHLSVVQGTFDVEVFSTPFSNGRYSYNRGCLSLPPVTTCTRDDLYCSQPGV